MSPGRVNPTLPDPGPGYPKSADVGPLPLPAPLGPMVSPLPEASSCWYTLLTAEHGSHAYAVAARAPRDSVLSFLLCSVSSPFTEHEFGYSLRGHSSLPTTLVQFESGALIFPTHINNDTMPGWAAVPYQTTPTRIPLHIVLRQNTPLIILGLRNASEASESLGLYLVIDPPPGPQP